MASVYKRQDGRWVAQYYFNQKRKYVYGKTKKKVSEKLAIILADIINEEYVDNTDILFIDWLNNWLENYVKASVRTTTYTDYEIIIRGHIAPMFIGIKLKNLNTQMFQEFFMKKSIGGRLDKKPGGLSPKTLKNIKNMLNCSLKQAKANGLIKNIFVDNIKLAAVEQKEMRVLDSDEQKKLIQAIKESEITSGFGIVIALFTGVRVGELLALKWEDINLLDRKIKIKSSLKRVKNFDETSEFKTKIERSKTKTKTSTRTIDLIDGLYNDLVYFKEKQAELLNITPTQQNNIFVVSNELGGYIEPRTYHDIFKKHIKLADIKDTNLHALRHTFATRGLESGMDIYVLSKILGHAQASTTLNKYGHALPDHKKESMDKINSIYF